MFVNHPGGRKSSDRHLCHYWEGGNDQSRATRAATSRLKGLLWRDSFPSCLHLLWKPRTVHGEPHFSAVVEVASHSWNDCDLQGPTTTFWSLPLPFPVLRENLAGFHQNLWCTADISQPRPPASRRDQGSTS